jgi:hypothetical protein
MTTKMVSTIAAAMFLTGAASAYVVPLVEEGRPRARLVLPAEASPGLIHAAGEIVSHVEQATGAALPVGTERGQGTNLVLQVDPTAQPQRDSFRIQTMPNEIRLVGASDSGTVFACYAFLEDVGFRWLAPEESCTVIPKATTLGYPETDRVETPGFADRFFYVRSDEGMLWALRNRLNGFHTKGFAEAHGDLTYLPPHLNSIHSLAQNLPPEQYFATHPEYYSLIGGKRVPAQALRNQVCTSNPDVIRLIAERVRTYFLANPKARVFSIAPNDGYGWCECERCRALDQTLCGGKTWYRTPSEPVVSDRLCAFANAVAEQAVRDLPGRELYMFAYVSYCEPPETARPDPQVTHVVCHYIPACYAHPIDTPGCPDNERYKRYLEGWAKLSPQMMVYCYTDKSQWLGLPRPVVRQMAADIRYYRSLGIRKYLAQSSGSGWIQAGPLYYVTAKLLWNPDADAEALIREWNQGMYGAAGGAAGGAADEMVKWYDAVDAVVRESGGHYGGDPLSEVSNVYAPGCFEQAGLHLDRALELADKDSARDRVRRVRDQFLFGADGVEVICRQGKWAESGDPEALRAAKVAAQRLVTGNRSWGGTSLGRFKESLSSLLTLDANAVMWSGWGKEETKGGKTCRNADETGVGDSAAGWASFRKVLTDSTKTYRITMEVWGESAFGNLMICTKGKGSGTPAGGVWKPLPRDGAVSGKPEWCKLTFTVPPESRDKETKLQNFGFGGADSQAWVADIRVEEVPPER